MTLGQRIGQYRRNLGISQEELGGRLGVSRQAVSKWETDTATPDMENLLALACIFGISVAELTATPEPPVSETENTKPNPPFSHWRGPKTWGVVLIGLVVLVLLAAAGVGFVWSNLRSSLPDNVTCFSLVDGEPNFSQRQEPEQEDKDATQQVYIAWNQLLSNKNLSAEEQYRCRQDIFSHLPDIDWSELDQLSGSQAESGSTIFSLISFLEEQAPYSSAEILWVQMGCTAEGLDGVYSERYSEVLAKAFFGDPVVFAKALDSDTTDDATKHQVLSSTAYAADLYPAELSSALDTLERYLNTSVFTDSARGWAELLQLYLVTPINERSELPRTPAGLPE